MTDSEEDFATMFEASVKARRFKRGQTIEGTIVAIGPEVALVNVGGKGEATDPAQHIGRVYAFRIIEYKDGGKNLVVSRRALLEEEQRANAVEVRRSIVVGDVLTGRVTTVPKFGAFVDLGAGVQGLIHGQPPRRPTSIVTRVWRKTKNCASTTSARMPSRLRVSDRSPKSCAAHSRRARIHDRTEVRILYAT